MISERVASDNGFTLVEVLVALAIVAISFMALYGSMQQVVQATTLMQDKTFASWVAFDQLAELRLSGQIPDKDKIEGETEMGGVSWRYTVSFVDTESAAIRQIIVRVAPENDPDRVIAESTGVLLRQSGSGNTQGTSGRNFGNSGEALVSSAPGDPNVPGATGDDGAPEEPTDDEEIER